MNKQTLWRLMELICFISYIVAGYSISGKWFIQCFELSSLTILLVLAWLYCHKKIIEEIQKSKNK
jgi:hypothetical protein